MDSGDGGTESWPGQWDDRETDTENGGDDTNGEHETNGGHETGGNGENTRTLNWRDDAERGGENGTDGTVGTVGNDGNDGNDENDGRGPLGYVRWFMRTDEEWIAFVREVVSSLAIVAAIGLILFAASGVWPPMVAVESGSMAPNLQIGDMVFIMEEHRFAGEAAYKGTGIVTYQAGAAVGYKEFNKYGEVIVYHPNGNEQRTPIIHRARFWVNEGQNWYDEANQEFLGGADNCKELLHCPAEHAGFITKGDNNAVYDQAVTISEPVKPEWIIGTAEFRIPWLGRIRLLFGRLGASATSTGTVGGVVASALAGVGAVRIGR